jgi:hypothetical protein
MIISTVGTWLISSFKTIAIGLQLDIDLDSEWSQSAIHAIVEILQ